MRRLELAERVIELRERAELTQAEAAKKAGVGVTTWSNIETGTITRPHARTIIKIARALGTDPEDLASPKAEGPPSPEWALAALDEEFDSWVKTAKASEVHKLWNELTERVKGIEDAGRREQVRERITKCIDRFFELQGIDNAATRERWPSAAAEDEGREAGTEAG